MLNRWVLSWDRETATEGAEVTRSGRLFQTCAAATGKARSPTVRSRVRLTINDEDELERSHWRASTSATWQSSSVRYTGADPCKHLYTRTDCLNAICSEAFSHVCLSVIVCTSPSRWTAGLWLLVSLKSNISSTHFSQNDYLSNSKCSPLHGSC